MGYLEKENAIIRKLQDTKYELFDGDRDDALQFLDQQLGHFPEYANAVITQQQQLPIIYARYEGEDLRDRVESLDRRRRNIHECAISSVNVLNRLSSRLGLEPFADVDTSDRHAVANMVGDYIGELYRTGTHGMDEATLNKTTEYSSRQLQDRRRRVADMCAGIEQPENGSTSLQL